MKKLMGLVLLTVGVVAFAETPVPDGDPFTTLVMLIANLKSMGPIAIAMAVITILVQGGKAFLGDDFKYKRVAVTILGVAYGIFVSLNNGLGIVEALVLGLVTSGGAVAIYEAIKGIQQSFAKVKL